MAPALHSLKQDADDRANDTWQTHSSVRATKNFNMRVVWRTLTYRSSLSLDDCGSPSFVLPAKRKPPVFAFGSRLSAPRPVAMSRLLDRLGRLRKLFTH